MKDNRGFTLVELLATIAIMAILMIVAVPNIINILDKNKKTTYVEDARKLVALAKYRLNSDINIKRPTFHANPYGCTTDCTYDYRCVGFHYDTLVKEGEIEKGPEGGTYNLSDDSNLTNGSFVIIKYTEYNKFYYGVQLVEKYTVNGVVSYSGIKYISDSSLLNKTDAIKKYVVTGKDSFLKPGDVSSSDLSDCYNVTWR